MNTEELIRRAEAALDESAKDFGTSMEDKMDLMERLIRAASELSGLPLDDEREIMERMLRMASYDFWRAVGLFCGVHAAALSSE